MILGVGVDIVEVQRLRKALERHRRLYQRLFSDRELQDCEGSPQKFARLAGRFAAKEAVAKALGTSLSWKDVEVTNESGGRPLVILSRRAKAMAKGARIHLSISHGKEYAVAHAVACKEEGA